MKLSIIVFLAVVTLVACTTPKKSPGKKPPGKNCVCREKECTDVSCEEKNCLCLVKAIKILQSQKDAKYPKKWLDAYLQFVQERCLCIQGCQKICNPKEFIDCSAAAYDRFLCKYNEWLHGIVGDRGYDNFIEDIRRINAECINKDCKPICSGNGDCNPFFIKPKDCGCTKNCVHKLIETLANLIHDKEVKEALLNFVIYTDSYYDSFLLCTKIPKPSQQEICYNLVRAEIRAALDELFKDLVKNSGPCTAISILSAINQGVLDCAIKKK